MDGSLMCKHGAQGGQTGRAVAQVNEVTHELVCSAHGVMPMSLLVQRRVMRASCGQHCGPCCRQSSCQSQEHASLQTLQPYSRVSGAARSGAQRDGDRTPMCGDESTKCF